MLILFFRVREALRLLAVLLTSVVLTCVVPSHVWAQAQVPASHAPAPTQSGDAGVGVKGALDRTFGIAAYGVGWAGSYGAMGVGGRVRVEPFAFLGVDVFGEGVVVDWPGAFRHDWQVGFDLYSPIRLGDRVRVLPKLGFCTVFSFVEPAMQGVPRADDILFGAHAGAALEVAVVGPVALFAELQALGWFGHNRSTHGWSAGIADSYTFFGNARLLLGTSLHFDV